LAHQFLILETLLSQSALQVARKHPYLTRPAKQIETTSMENKFMTGQFLEACQNPQFHHRWMTAETWWT